MNVPKLKVRSNQKPTVWGTQEVHIRAKVMRPKARRHNHRDFWLISQLKSKVRENYLDARKEIFLHNESYATE
jgi:hypothetical protein